MKKTRSFRFTILVLPVLLSFCLLLFFIDISMAASSELKVEMASPATTILNSVSPAMQVVNPAMTTTLQADSFYSPASDSDSKLDDMEFLRFSFLILAQ